MVLKVLVYGSALAVVRYSLAKGRAGFAYITSGASALRAQEFIDNPTPFQFVHGLSRAIFHHQL